MSCIELAKFIIVNIIDKHSSFKPIELTIILYSSLNIGD